MAQGANDVYFNLFLPATPKPPGGWPVAIFGHGFGDDKNDSPLLVASLMAANGIATVAINAVGHGFGPLGTLTVSQTVGAPVTFSAGGRGFDQNGDGVIGSTEGLSAFPLTNIVGDRDGLRQTAIDLMQLVREIRVGMDVDGDGTPDLDPSRIYYLGQSLGGIYGTIFLAVEPNVLFGVPNVPGGSLLQIARLSPDFRVLVALALAIRTPSLLNEPFPNFNEALPLRDQPPLINTVPGADAIQQYLDHSDWVGQAGDPVAYAPYLQKAPLSGMPGKSVIIQFAKGDQTVPNPTSSALIRAGALTDRTTYYRNDLAFAADSSVPKNPHIFLAASSRSADSQYRLRRPAADRDVLRLGRNRDNRSRQPHGAAVSRLIRGSVRGSDSWPASGGVEFYPLGNQREGREQTERSWAGREQGSRPHLPRVGRPCARAGVRRSPVQKLKSIGGVATPRPLVMIVKEETSLSLKF
jgi:hypothetical protein